MVEGAQQAVWLDAQLIDFVWGTDTEPGWIQTRVMTTGEDAARSKLAQSISDIERPLDDVIAAARNDLQSSGSSD